MSLGLSPILNVRNNNYASQKSTLDEDELSNIQSYDFFSLKKRA